MAITDPDVKVYEGTSMVLVPTDTPGVDMVRHDGHGSESEDEGMHALIHYNNVRVQADSLLGAEGEAFAIAQTRLGGGRVLHAMRTVAVCQHVLDMLCERVLSRETQGSLLAQKQFMQVTLPTRTPSSSSSASWCTTPPGKSISHMTTDRRARTSPPSRC